jgi:hypothetical protein
MKKCSHSVHHSLTELNITPLLDLGVRAAGDLHHHDHPAGERPGLETADGGQTPERPAAQGQLHLRPGRRQNVSEQKGSGLGG